MKLNTMLTCINPTLRRLYHKLPTQFLVFLSFETKIVSKTFFLFRKLTFSRASGKHSTFYDAKPISSRLQCV